MSDLAILGFLMGDMSSLELFRAGGFVMWPILFVSLVSLTVIVERFLFIMRENRRRNPALVDQLIARVEAGRVEEAVDLGKPSDDFVARVIVNALTEHDNCFGEAYLRASNQELNRFSQGLPLLDTIITAAPLLGLLGTVTGMMRTFGELGSGDLASGASQITGGVAEALIATACGLFIAVCALFPYNYLNSQLERARLEVEDVANALEVAMSRTDSSTAPDQA